MSLTQHYFIYEMALHQGSYLFQKYIAILHAVLTLKKK